MENIQEAAAWVRSQAPDFQPKIGVVLGSGLGAFCERLDASATLSYADIPHFPQSTVAGHSGQLVLGTLEGTPCAVLSGRIHFYEGYDQTQVVFPIRVLKALGIHTALITNASGAVNPQFSPGEMMVIRDHINLTGQNPLHGPNDDTLGPRFPDMSRAYHPEGRKALHEAAAELGLSLREGVYVGVAGPSYETPAEIRMMQTIGGDAVGMSTVPEVIAGVHAGLRIAGLSVLTNHAAGVVDEPLNHEDVTRVGAQVRDELSQLLASAIQRLA